MLTPKEELDEVYADRLLSLQKACDHVCPTFHPGPAFSFEVSVYGTCERCGADLSGTIRLKHDDKSTYVYLAVSRVGAIQPFFEGKLDREPGYMSSVACEAWYTSQKDYQVRLKLADRVNTHLAGRPASEWGAALSDT